MARVYLDASVALAELLTEDRRPPPQVWERPLISSRLLQYEITVRLGSLGFAASHEDKAAALLARVDLVEMRPDVLARTLDPFPVPLRTLDALHLATIEYLRGRGQQVELASYDERMVAVAKQLGIALAAV